MATVCNKQVECHDESDEKLCSDEGFSNIIIFTTTGAIVLVYLCAKIRKFVFEKWSTKEEEDQAMEVGCGKVDCREILNEFESQYEDDEGQQLPHSHSLQQDSGRKENYLQEIFHGHYKSARV